MYSVDGDSGVVPPCRCSMTKLVEIGKSRGKKMYTISPYFYNFIYGILTSMRDLMVIKITVTK